MRIYVFIFSLVLSLSQAAWAADVKAGETAYVAKGCIGCHGPAGKSANPTAFPSTAGLDAAYTVEQLNAFRAGTRSNPMMSPMAAGLADEDIANIAAYLAAQK